MKAALRWTFLLGTLGATVAASFWGASEEDVKAESVRVTVTSDAQAQRSSREAVADAGRVSAPRMQPVGPNLFAVRETPVKRQARKEPPPKPTAPPLPYRYQGKVIEEGQVIAFLSDGARTHVLRAGDRVASYLVEEISPGGMTLVYLPLNEKQQLMFGNSN